MVELLKEDRKVIKKGDKYIFTFFQEQEYTEEAVATIIKDMEERLKQNEEWLHNFEKNKIENMERLAVALDKNKEKLEKENKFLKEGIELWKKPK